MKFGIISVNLSLSLCSIYQNVLAPDCNKLPNASCGGENDLYDSNLALREVNPYDYVDGWPPFSMSIILLNYFAINNKL